MTTLHPVSPELLATFVQGAADLVKTPRGLAPWRLPSKHAELYHAELLPRVLSTAGVHLRFATQARAFRLDFDQAPTLNSDKEGLWDVFVDGAFFSRHTVPCGENACLSVDGLPKGSKEIVVYFPGNTHSVLKGLSSDEPVLEAPFAGLRWLTHGSSITHCRSAAPGETWPAIVAREAGWSLRNLGFAGTCKFDPIVARAISKLPADRISLCLGINTTDGFYSLRTWIPAIEGFLLTVRDGHPETPLLVITPILSPPRESWDKEPCRIGLRTMRQLLAEIVEKFCAMGDLHIHLLDGLKLIGPGDESTMPDELHPDSNGIHIMAERFLRHMPPGWLDGIETRSARQWF
jgi:hypothetical protein